jgi:DNA polymerase I
MDGDMPLRNKGALVSMQHKGFHGYCLQADVVSQYPSALMSYNMSPESISYEYEGKQIHLSDEKHPFTIGFDQKEESVFAQITRKYFQVKAQSKKGTIQYQSAKEMINIIYGGACYSRSIFFTLPIAMSITCVGRQIITSANQIVESLGDGYKVICNDTDALTFTIPETVKTFADCE